MAVVLQPHPVSSSEGARASEETSRSVMFRYRMNVDDVPEDAKTIKVWIPLPQDDAYQTISQVKVHTGGKHSIVTDWKYGNRFVHFEVANGGGKTRADLSYAVERRTRKSLTGNRRAPRAPADLASFLMPSRFVTWDGAVGEEAKRVVGGAQDPLEKARRIYDHIVNTVRYGKSGKGWGRGDSAYACDAREGNCTDFHSLFIGEARSQGVPARFVMGFPIPNDAPAGAIGGYHCWAEFYTPELGWVPVDASDAYKHPERRAFLFGGLDPNRVQFTMGRDITVPGIEGGPLNFAIYPYVEVDGKPHEAVTATFGYENVN